MSMPIDWPEDGTLPRKRLCNIQYRDFVRDPIGTAEQIYRQFGIEMTPEGRKAMQDYAAESSRSPRPAHRYEFGSEELIAQGRAAFKRYREYFKVPSEV